MERQLEKMENIMDTWTTLGNIGFISLRVLGPKYYNMNGIWDLKPYYLGPWTAYTP